jgi:basic membrane protein A
MSDLFDAVLSRRSLVKASVAAGAVAALPFSLTSVGAQDKVVVTMVTDTAGLGDQNFNDLANNGGTKAAQELGIEWKVNESVDQASFVPNLTSGAENSQLVVGVGFLLTDAMGEVAPQFPDKFFQLLDAVADAGNVQSVLFKEQQIGYLAGIVSGMMTKTNKIGIVGGQRIPPVIRYEVGFVAGVKSINDQAQIIINYTDTFGDPNLGKSTAAAQYNDGCDIVFPIAGSTGTGAYQAASELNKMGQIWVIGVDAPQDHLAPGYELCVAKKGVDVAVFDGCKQVVDGDFKTGTLNLGLEEGGVSMVMYEDRVPADVQAQVHGYQQAIIDGTIVPPVDDDTLKTFQVPEKPAPIEATPSASPEASPGA